MIPMIQKRTALPIELKGPPKPDPTLESFFSNNFADLAPSVLVQPIMDQREPRLLYKDHCARTVQPQRLLEKTRFVHE